MLPLPLVTGLQLKALIPFWTEAPAHHGCLLHSVDHLLLLPVSKVVVGLVHLFFMHEGNQAVGITGAWGGPNANFALSEHNSKLTALNSESWA